MRRIRTAACALGLALAWPGFAVAAPAETAVVQELADELARVPSDPPPDAITNDTHYLVSNERRLDFFAPEIRDVGGIHVGVGSDPNYLLAGWARSELVVVIDFDQDVVDLHALHALFFAIANDGAQYRRSWDGGPQARASIALRFFDPLVRARMLALYERARPEVARRIDIMQTKLQMAGETWFLDEDEDYAHVHELAASGRIIALRGDFTEPGVVAELGDRLRESGRRVGSLYLSNIEQYFMYTPQYRTNMLGLPLSGDTVVLRTLPGKPAGFQYMAQQGDNFHRWLGYERAYSVYRVRGLAKGEKLTASEFFRIEGEPPR